MTNEDLLIKLISYKTVFGNKKDEFIDCFSFIKEYLSDNKNLSFKEFDFDDNISMLITNTKDNDFDILFIGHIDVVPAKENQFKAKVVDNKIYGRGSFDMKGHDSVMINIMKKIDNSKKVALLLTTDEERGGFYGIPKVIEKYPFKSKLAIVPDGGNNFDFITEEKGVLQLKLTAYGKSAHASKPYCGKNAILELMNLYNKLIEKYPLPKNENEFKTSINLGTISGGRVVNMVPECATMMIDIRHIYSDKKESIIKYINKVNKNIVVEIFAQGEAYKANLKDKNVQKYIKVCESVLKRKLNFVPCESASDARFLEKYGISAIIMNACGSDLHGENEYIKISSLDKLTKIYNKIIEEI